MGILEKWARRQGFVKPDEVKKPARGVRGFSAAQISRLAAGFGTTPININHDLRYAWGAVVARARELSKNDDYVRHWLRIARNNIVGARGVQLRAQIKSTAGNPDPAANRAVEAAWREWSRAGTADVSGRYSLRDIEKLAVTGMARDGEALIEIAQGSRFNEFGFALRVHDPLALPWDYSVDRYDRTGNRIVMGVELDSVDRAVAYHFMTNNPATDSAYTMGGRTFNRVPAVNGDGTPRVLHIFQAEEASQVRGASGMASAIMRLRQLGGYEEASLVAARVGAAKMLFYTQDADAVEYQGDDEDAAGNPIVEVEPGVAETLPPGWDIKEFNPSNPSVNYGEYVKAILRGAAAGLGISYYTLANDLESVNFSSGRLGAQEDREAWKDAQEFLIEHLHRRIFPVWLEQALARRKIRINGQPLGPSKVEKLKQVTWQPRRWEWVDPMKDMTANEKAVALRVRSVSDIIRERGQDPDEVFEEVRRERESMAEMGITPEMALAQTVEGESDGHDDDEQD